MIKLTRVIEFDAGHRVIGHKNKCKYLHGHRYKLEVSLSSDELDYMGMVIDLGDLKQIVKDWVDSNWDHNLILNENDRKFGDMVSEMTGQKIYYLNSNPTVENMALHLKREIFPILFQDTAFKAFNIKLYETPNSFVEV